MFSYSIVPFSKGPYSGKICIKMGNFEYGWLDIFRTRNLIEGKVLLYEENRLFLGPCIDNLGSVVIIRDGGILYLTTGKFSQKT